MVDFLTKPFQKMPKNNRAKGVALKSPDIKIIMYVCTPLNKVFGFQGSKIRQFIWEYIGVFFGGKVPFM